MKEFLKDVLINILVDLTSRYFIATFTLLLGGSGIYDFGKFIERKEYMSAFIAYLLFSLIISGVLLIAYEIFATKNKRIKLNLLPKDSEESKDLWDKKYSAWLEIENNEKFDFDDCFVYLKRFDDNGIDYLSEVTKITNKFEWENYPKGQSKKVRSGDKERINIANSGIGDNGRKFFCFEGGKVVIPQKYRFGITIAVSGKIKGIRKEFVLSGYMIHEMLDFEKTITKRLYLEPKVL